MVSLRRNDVVEIFAHRGFSGKYPENTLLAIRKAVELGVDWIEVDVWLSLDHNVIVLHDKRLNRTTNGKGTVIWKTVDEIKKYKVKNGNQHVPVLEEVFELVKKRSTKVNIEIKNMWAAKPVVELIKKHGMQSKVMVSSGSVNALRIIKKELPSVDTAYLFFITPNTKWNIFVTSLFRLSFRLTHFWVLVHARKSGVQYIHLSYPFATKAFIKKLHKQGYKVNVWTVNTPLLMKKLIKSNVDGIITNHPDKLKRLLIRKKKPKKRPGIIRRLHI
jgi:glycerophosphoryl diester phosphodiesterase